MTQLKSDWLCLFVAASLAGAIAGCGSSDEEDAAGDAGATSDSASAGHVKSVSTRTGGGKKTKDDRPAIDGIPLDVFFPEPLLVASESGTVASTGTAAPVPGTTPDAGTEPQTAEPEQPAASAGGAVSWEKVIPAELVKGEMKSIRLQLQKRLTTLASYNSSYLEIPVFGATLSLLAEVARRHPDDIAWKENARYIRALGSEMVEVCSSASARGRKSYDLVNDAFLKVCDILDNNAPAELPEAEEEADLLDVADMGYLMKRLKRGMEWMQNNTGSEDAFKENADLAQREVSVIATIGQAFADESYGYGDDEDFTGHTFEMRDAATQMSTAVEGGDFGTFDELRSKVDQKCTQCHMVYRTG